MRIKSFEVMRAATYKEGMVQGWEPYRVEPKMDGVRVICLATAKKVTFYSRNGRVLDMFGHLEKDVRRLLAKLYRVGDDYADGAVFDGEMCGSTFNEIGGAIHRKGHTEVSAQYHLFHAMPIGSFAKGVDTVPQMERRLLLRKTINTVSVDGIHLLRSMRADGHAHLMQLYSDLQLEGFEGAMLKNMWVPWVGKRTKDWLKLKAEETKDLPIVGWKPGKGKYSETLGAIIVSNKGVEVPVSGMSDEERAWLFKRRKKLEAGTMVAEVAFQQETKRRSLRHPRFVRLRRDKEKV